MLTQPDFQPPIFIDYLAVALWALSGAIVGWRKGYDIVGVFVVALASAVGGSLLRDGLLLQRIPPIGTNAWYMVLIAVAVLFVSLTGRYIQRYPHWRKIVAVIDALATPMLIVVGAQLAMSRGLPTTGIILCGAISGIGGGLTRDLLVGDTPELLRPGQYNTLLVVMAAFLFLGLERTVGLRGEFAAWIAIGLFFIARLTTIRFNWRSRPVSEFELVRSFNELSARLPRLRRTEDADAAATPESPTASQTDDPDSPGIWPGRK